MSQPQADESGGAPVSEWRAAPFPPVPLPGSEVHLFSAPLEPDPATRLTLRRHLSRSELRRSSEFHFEEHRRRFIVARGTLREILATYAGQAPTELRFVESAGRKPALEPGCVPIDLRFNLSHSREEALVAVACGREVGVDLEAVDAGRAAVEIAERLFSRREVMALQRIPAALQPEAFFNCWTRKEAYVKARGEGLAIALDSFDVAFLPDEPPRLIRVAGDPGEAARWQMVALRPKAGYVGALVVEGSPVRVRCWRWRSLQPATWPPATWPRAGSQ